MDKFTRLVEVLDRLIGPGGCPWDQKQTLHSTRTAILEETHEVIDAIDLNDSDKICEELGDLLFVTVFLCRLAQKENKCSLEEVLQGVTDKLVRRHPHVFGEVQLANPDEVVKQWEKIKKQEKQDKNEPVSALHDIPKAMPALMRTQKVIKRISHTSYTHVSEAPSIDNEESLGRALFNLVQAAHKSGLNAELALNRILSKEESAYLAWEKQQL